MSILGYADPSSAGSVAVQHLWWEDEVATAVIEVIAAPLLLRADEIRRDLRLVADLGQS